ncbi:MAG TPA: hypothetical protein VGL56_06625 [Fimbriimonadaceae bacterium]|jgi:hypothetical protein
MRSTRYILSVITALLLVAGYLASQYYYFFEPTQLAGYVAKVDAAPVRILCALLFVAALLLAFISDKEPQP